MEILRNKDSGQQDTTNRGELGKAVREERLSMELPEQKEMDEGTWAMIAETMSAFRNS